MRLVDRGRLVAVLDRAVARKVTIISAPAGSGKTSLLRAWAARSAAAPPAAFVAVPRDQRDEQLFWLTLLRSIRHTLDRSQTEEPLNAAPRFYAEEMIDRVLPELADYPGRLVLVIDDLHDPVPPNPHATPTPLIA